MTHKRVKNRFQMCTFKMIYCNVKIIYIDALAILLASSGGLDFLYFISLLFVLILTLIHAEISHKETLLVVFISFHCQCIFSVRLSQIYSYLYKQYFN